jgi:L-alanine-DL-glutamate epimerase-like enolase superfamily enzyme
MKISGIKVVHSKAGWRTWSFIKITTTNKNLVGWSEVSESNGSPAAIQGAVRDLTPLLVGEDPLMVNELYHRMRGRNRQTQGGAVFKAISGIENALLDIKGKYHGVPVCELFGGPIRKSIPLYWSHFGTSRVRAFDHCDTLAITEADSLSTDEICKQSTDLGYDTIKTNIPVFNNKPFIHMPGFSRTPGGPELNLTKKVYNAAYEWVNSLRESLPNSHIILDLNYNFNPADAVRLIYDLDEAFNIHWAEIDTHSAKILRDIREGVFTQICSCENLIGVDQYMPYLTDGAVDVVSIDVLWNGLIRSLEIAQIAAAFGKQVTPHNHYSNLATFMSGQFCSLVPNLKIMEYDVDDVRWRDDLCTAVPHIHQGVFHLSYRPGWGADVNEVVLSEYAKFI